MIRIYADFNSQDEQGRVILNTVGSREDVAAHEGELHVGDTVVLYMTDEFELLGTLDFDGGWVGIPDFATVKYLDR
jgi:hypothetical protein